MSPKPSPPQWIRNAYNPAYLRNVLGTLAQRESRRDAARSASRRQAVESDSNGSPGSSKAIKATPEQIEHYSVKIGAGQDNEYRNRYLHLEPYDRTRVVLSAQPNCGDGYLNASWVLEKHGGKWWIATQAPLPHTSHSFLSVLLQPVTRPPPALLAPTTSATPSTSPHPTTRVRTVVQLTQNVESGRRKAHAYFPSKVGKSMIVPAEEGSEALGVKATLLHQETIQEAHCLRSTIAVVPVKNPPPVNTSTYESVEFDDEGGKEDKFGEVHDQRVIFTHLLYTSWPDHGVPEEEDRASLVEFIRLADRLNRDVSLASYPPTSSSTSASNEGDLDPDPPIIVGCSAGVGRTGSFIALSSLMRHLGDLPPANSPTPSSVLPPSPLGPLPEQMSEDCVAQEIDGLREQRQRMVDRPEQVVLIYEVLLKDVFEAS
ncbi:protein-tyrosine phosphatase 2 [Coprinopsis cinerea okayama7|uniref:Protein-tyrosine phosphatase 2 n=1 Tax=Coprinopsis cinerea (strain Okayama-7 / 130 / ATCC MYA-4618 / FGSC 9003) TaxID=240176 RepID=A8N3C2_COPC7|nr:protein-tyrosine phosphatase 2 [Coprinopsis cinerea okayama7\|eukprot:XP_001829367.1 protein-tyrosine phosphatase 2 [Coprinopsis cinerea okayama7\